MKRCINIIDIGVSGLETTSSEGFRPDQITRAVCGSDLQEQLTCLCRLRALSQVLLHVLGYSKTNPGRFPPTTCLCSTALPRQRSWQAPLQEASSPTSFKNYKLVLTGALTVRVRFRVVPVCCAGGVVGVIRSRLAGCSLPGGRRLTG